MAKITTLKDRACRVVLKPPYGTDSELILPDGTHLEQWAMEFRVEQKGGEPPCVWVKLLATTESVEAAEEAALDGISVPIPDGNYTIRTRTPGETDALIQRLREEKGCSPGVAGFAVDVISQLRQ